MRDESDWQAQIIVRLRAKDPGAMELLYDAYSGRAFGLAYRLVGEASTAEDVVQEAFLAVWQQADRIDPARGQLISLLLTVVHHKAVDCLRKQGGHVTLPLQPSDSSGGPDPVDLASQSNDRAVINSALAALPVEQRRAVKLAFFGGYSHREVARATKTPLGTVKSRLRLAFDRLRFILEEKVRA